MRVFKIVRVVYSFEINDLLRKAKGEPTTIQLCREAYEAYLANPTVGAREKLKITYEQVLEREHVYVGYGYQGHPDQNDHLW